MIDDIGEDYLFEPELFREVDDLTGVATEVTVGLTWPMKAAIHHIANQHGISMSALICEWIDELLDTPGIHRSLHKLGECMVQTAADTIADADVVLWLLDVNTPPTAEDPAIAELLQQLTMRKRIALPPLIVGFNQVARWGGDVDSTAKRMGEYTALLEWLSHLLEWLSHLLEWLSHLLEWLSHLLEWLSQETQGWRSRSTSSPNTATLT